MNWIEAGEGEAEAEDARVGRTALYRLIDADGQLLYVGITWHLEKRLKRHAYDKPWWPEVAETKVEWFDGRLEAGTAEKKAIVNEKPKYNLTSVPAFHQALQERARLGRRRRR